VLEEVEEELAMGLREERDEIDTTTNTTRMMVASSHPISIITRRNETREVDGSSKRVTMMVMVVRG